jgi:hypothetical protein
MWPGAWLLDRPTCCGRLAVNRLPWLLHRSRSPPCHASARYGHRHTGVGEGYGSAVTVAASRWAMTAGAVHVVLFTDLANLVSNSIYPKIGYRPVHDAVELTFIPATSSTNA